VIARTSDRHDGVSNDGSGGIVSAKESREGEEE
jgi:hypothetical protein